MQRSEADVSESGKDLIKAMLELKPIRRPSALDCLMHPWFSETLVEHDLTNLDLPINERTLNNLAAFNGGLKMQ